MRRTLEEYRSAGDLANLENDWIAAAEESPQPVERFLEIALPLAEEGEQDRARSLLELYDSELEARKLHAERLELLRRAGTLYVKPSKLQKEIVATLEKMWGEHGNFAAMVAHVGLGKPTEDPVKLLDRVRRLESLLTYDVGTVVAMAGQGVGRIAEVNLSLESLKVVIDQKPPMSVGFRAAAKLLRPLAPGHFLRTRLEDPQTLVRLAKENPPELLRAVLESGEGPLTAADIRDAVSGIVDAVGWSAWWNAARKHPQVLVDGSGRQSYRWEASSEGAMETIRARFEKAPTREKLDILRRNSERSMELARELGASLASLATKARGKNPGLAFEIWYSLERAGVLPEDLGWSAHDLVKDGDVKTLVAGIDDRLLRERALAIARERRADWPALFRDLFVRETDPRTLALLAEGLRAAAPDQLDRLLDDVVSQPRRAPAAFVWLAERAANDEALRARAPLRLLQQILGGLGTEELAQHRARLRALVDSGGTVPRLLGHLTEDQATAAHEAIGRAAGLEPFQKTALENALLLRFPILRGDSSGPGPIYATREAIARKREELRELQEVEIPRNRKAIEEARALGDLRENFEYKSARQRHEYLSARQASLHNELGRARPIDAAAVDASQVRIGTRVTLVAESGKETRVLTILGPWESDPENGVISYESELAERLLGMTPGQSVVVAESPLRVDRVEPYRDA